jgi:hypothetical protein
MPPTQCGAIVLNAYRLALSHSIISAVQRGAPAAFVVDSSSELVQSGQQLVSDLVVPSGGLATNATSLTLVCRITVPVGLPVPSPALVNAGDAAKYSSQLQQQLHTVSAHVPPSMPLSTLVQLVLAQAGSVSEKVLKCRHEFLQVDSNNFVRVLSVLTPYCSSICRTGFIVSIFAFQKLLPPILPLKAMKMKR